MSTQSQTLPAVGNLRPIYFLPEDPFVEDVLIPCFAAATNVDCMVGFFSSEALVSLAPGLATFINRSDGHFRLIISPVIGAADWDAIEAGVMSPETVANDFLDRLVITKDAIQRFTLECLTWMIREGRIKIQIALVKNGIFHPKVWLFHGTDGLMVTAHGSSNLTDAGIRKNVEQIAVAKSWDALNDAYTANALDRQFDELWEHSTEGCVVLDLPDAVRERLVQTYDSDSPPQESDLNSLFQRASMIRSPNGKAAIQRDSADFVIPTGLRYQDGPFAHQGQAVDAWVEAGHSGILEMATGSGKTITAMICAHRLFELTNPLLIVVSAPYVPLVQQWCDEIIPFGIEPVNLTIAGGPRGRARILGRLRRRLKSGSRGVEVIVVSHSTLSDEGFQAEISRFQCAKLLIADEAHNLGSEGFIARPPEFFDHTLGLSATPVRQYDDEGTESLFEFLGQVVFRFTLEQAIGKCLVEYDYFVHPVELTDQEMVAWSELTERIRANAWRQDQNGGVDEYVTKLLRDRRAILEVAENKIAALRDALNQEDLSELRHTLIYASDKGPRQLEDVNVLLNEKGVRFHQLTYEETGDRDQTRNILNTFQDGALRVLTAKRVLDEGVNIPQIQKAFILASTTVERQWVQRRGRLLRKCQEIGKTHSQIHDFVALPPNLDSDVDSRAVVKGELNRVQEFASLARNAGRSDGPLKTIDKLVQAAF